MIPYRLNTVLVSLGYQHGIMDNICACAECAATDPSAQYDVQHHRWALACACGKATTPRPSLHQAIEEWRQINGVISRHPDHHGNAGERHPRARLTDHDVRLMRDLRKRYGLTYKTLAEKFECGISTARDIVNYRTRTTA